MQYYLNLDHHSVLCMQPMLDYIDRKTLFGGDHNLAAMKHNIKTRPEVQYIYNVPYWNCCTR